MIERADVIVLGAGIVGISTAIHLQERGRSVLLVERRAPGEETSYGNAGVIERESLVPVTVPRRLSDLIPFALNRKVAAHYRLADLPRFLPWLNSLSRNSAPAAVDRYAAASDALSREAAREHHRLAGPSGVEPLFRKTGWLRLFRSPQSFAAAQTAHLARAKRYALPFDILTPEEAGDIEPHLSPAFYRAVLWPETESVASPGRVTKSYAEHFVGIGGHYMKTEARAIRPLSDGGFEIETGGAPLHAGQVVVALGPWSMDLLGPLGYRMPLAPKRGYHRHYRPQGNASLGRPVVDMDNGYAITPMLDGIRITSGIEFADRDAPPTPVQLARAEPLARELFPLGEPVEEKPWMGARPCFPDSLPAIGEAPRHKGLWFNFGHGHLGFTQGPISGRLLAELMTWSSPCVDPAPYSPARF
ncbi:NAD(P)/FAD-dependent oxidoreductase [Amorphus orientalis]|uniref:D-amino-acid dehydrogenase n=1 Tax=Amorphus orientalis TaxID=649198 RepID=A0AAE3VPZ2_9HYPH|nr:FAD-dependent oxidoreductase [Amorphus orientalis]MDQ0315655.1 D-amino-acid dehydrogenase [Amorphus orientalis]